MRLAEVFLKSCCKHGLMMPGQTPVLIRYAQEMLCFDPYLPGGGAVIVDGSAICGVGTPPAWQLLWPWLQVVALATCAVVVGRAFMARDARE